jgi:glycosyltransferase involved in cell wall biosynthesis
VLVDVVVSTRNNYSEKNFSLFYVIRALLSQHAGDLNIIVADNGSDDETVERLRATFGQTVGVLDTSDCTGNLSASRNAASQCGKSELILFLDDDMVVGEPGALRKAIAVGQRVDFACGAIRHWSPPSWPRLIRKDDPTNKVISTLSHTSTEPLSINRISGKNIIDNRSYLANFGTVKRSAFEAVGGYDEDYVGWGYQDTDLMYRLCLEGYEYDLFSAHGIVIYHLAHTVNKGSGYEQNRLRFLDKQRREGRVFNINHFFEIYESDGYSLFSDFDENCTS